jgi:sterol 3beta-glucosyltransferase
VFDVDESAGVGRDLFGPDFEGPEVVEAADFQGDDMERTIPPLQIAMLIVGTRGDVQPFVAIGKHLQVWDSSLKFVVSTGDIPPYLHSSIT